MKAKRNRWIVILMILALTVMLPMNQMDNYAFAVSDNASERGQEQSQNGGRESQEEQQEEEQQEEEQQEEEQQEEEQQEEEQQEEEQQEEEQQEEEQQEEEQQEEEQQDEEQDQQNGPEWDRSSLVFENNDGSECPVIYSEITNHGSGNMAGSVVWELYYSQSGNPKNGVVIASGTLGPLESGESEMLQVNLQDLEGEAGNYMFKAYQMDGHPGTGVLWSDSIQYFSCGDNDDSNNDDEDDSNNDDEDDSNNDDDEDDSNNDDEDDSNNDDDEDDSNNDDEDDSNNDDEDDSNNDDEDDSNNDDEDDSNNDDEDDSNNDDEDESNNDDEDDSNNDDEDDSNNGGNGENDSDNGGDSEEETLIEAFSSQVPQSLPEPQNMGLEEIASEVSVEIPVQTMPQALPQTGEKSASAYYLAGFILLAWGVFLKRRKLEA